MQVDLDVAYEGSLEPSPSLEARIRREAARLERFSDRITACHVALIGRSGRHRHGELFHWVPPAAGPVAFPRYTGGDVEQLCDSLVTRAGVLLLPGTVFGDRDCHFRVGLGRLGVPAAVEALERTLAT